jgi:hypothetical protein
MSAIKYHNDRGTCHETNDETFHDHLHAHASSTLREEARRRIARRRYYSSDGLKRT